MAEKTFIITEIERDGRKYTAAAYYEEGVLSLLKVCPSGETVRTGEVVLGTVTDVVQNIGAAFADAGGERVYISDARKWDPEIRPGKTVLLQRIADERDRKRARASMRLSFAGRYAVVSEGSGFSVSLKLTEGQKETLGGWKDEMPAMRHVVLRTNAAYAAKAEVLAEVKSLSERIDSIRERAKTRTTHSVLYRPQPFYVRMYTDVYGTDPVRIVTDLPAARDAFADRSDEGFPVPELWTDGDLPLPAVYNLERDIERLLRKTVYMKSGAYLLIEKTEAFTAIDVNSGKCAKGRKAEETYRRINLEAAAEVARQIRLRSLSGVILVDFISMKDPDHNTELIAVMRKALRQDHIHTEAVDLTPLGIMEIVRHRTERSLADVFGTAEAKEEEE